MKKAVCLFFSSIGLLLSLAARSQTPNPLYQHLPPKADHITEINYNQINSKGNLGAVLNSLPPMHDPKADLVVGILKDPGSAGIDLSHNIVMASNTATGDGADTLNFTNIVLQLSDSAKFRTAFTTAFSGVHLHRLPGKGTTAISAKDKIGIAWNDKIVILTIASHNPLSALEKTPAPAAEPHHSPAELALEKSVAALAGFTGTQWETDPRFLSGFATEEDIHFWSTGFNFGAFMSKFMSKMDKKSADKKRLSTMMNVASKYPKPKVLSTFNFGNGKIQFHMTTFNSADYAAAMRMMFDQPFNKDLLARVPDGLLLGFMTIHMNPAAMEGLMDKYGTRAMADSMLAKAGLTIDDILAPFTGDIMVAAVATDSTITADSSKKKVKFYFAAGIKDPARLMALGAKLGAKMPATTESGKPNPFAGMKDKMVIKDNLLIISSSKEDAENYANNTNRRSTDLLGDNNAIMKMVVDLKAVGTLLGSSMSGDPKMMIASRLLDRLDKIIITNGVMEGDNMTMDFQITTGDPGTNSLQTLLGIMH